MKLTQNRQGAVTVVQPDGPVTELDAEEFKRTLRQVKDESLMRFVLDVSKIPFVDSRGLEVLVEVNEEMARSGQALKICGANETLRQVLELTDLAGLFEHYEDVTDATRSFL